MAEQVDRPNARACHARCLRTGHAKRGHGSSRAFGASGFKLPFEECGWGWRTPIRAGQD